MRLTTSGGFFSAFSDVISFGVMLLSASTAASSAGCAAARSCSASVLTAAISCHARKTPVNGDHTHHRKGGIAV